MQATVRQGSTVRARYSDSDSDDLHAELNRLMDHYERPIYRFLLTMLGDSVTAEDCAQDTFIRAYGNLRRGRPVARTWLYRVARNLAIDELRRRERQRGSEVEPIDAMAEGLATSMDIRGALSRLSADDRAILSLLAIEGFSVAEIAQTLGIRPNAASMRIARARERLRARLGEDDGST